MEPDETATPLSRSVAPEIAWRRPGPRARKRGMPRVPVITTARLTLRGHRLDDFDAFASMWADPLVTRHIGGKPLSREDAWARFLRYVGHWTVMGYGFWIVEETATGRFVGEVGCADFRRDFQAPLDFSFDDAPEAGWVLAPWCHGRGFATEAVRAALAWTAQTLSTDRAVCLIHPDNQPSLRVAHRCGFQPYAQATFKNGPAVVLERRA
jgi:RimJ/RimL family protein N-acetyltransferase